MIEKILPAGVAVAEAFDDPPDACLFPTEEAVIDTAADKRRREFTTARWCARRALAELGVPPLPILPGEGGAPQWPDGIVGSMTHCDGYRAAAVAHDTGTVTIGIDAEPHEPLPGGLLGAVASEAELRRYERLCRAVPGVHWDRLLFSAKECAYKAWFPLTRRWLGFEEADIALWPDGTFTAGLPTATAPAVGIPPAGFAGSWLIADTLLVTAVTLARE
jgi:enterobactin synthetase component D / holo-[acyl-carrier protein] synthase